ncbi:MAG TPA: hypothetical protein VIG41_05225 [Micrococcaceae bacterium]
MKKTTYAVAGILLAAAIPLSGCTPSAPSGSDSNSAGPASSAAASSAGTASSAGGTAATEGGSAPSASGPSATKGAIVDGFPSTLIPVMPGATVQSTALDKTQALATASLVATSSATPAAIAAYYTTVYTNQGFTATAPTTVDNVTSYVFSRAKGQETVNVSVGPAGTGVTINVGAHVLPASLK